MKKCVLFLLTLTFLTVTNSLIAQGTAFTYQGQLQSGGSPANGNYDFTFALFNTSSTNTPQLGATLTDTNVGVTNGLFTVTLDFGSVFTGNATWLSIAVRTNGGAGFTALSPLQELTPTPYATYAPNSGTAVNVTGSIALSQLPGTVITNGETGVNITGNFTGNGAGLTNLAASALVGSGALIAVQTNVYSSFGTYAFTVPALTSSMVVKLWGAGGANRIQPPGAGGYGGAFSAVTLNVTPGQTYTVVVGMPGSSFGLGGADGSGDAGGGDSLSSGAGGGQASSLFQFNGTNYIMEAVAGGGGGAGLGTAAASGSNGIGAGNGGNYATGATTVGETSLTLMGGSGGVGTTGSYPGGGGGGGYGGGAGGVGTAGGNGGSYGTQIILANEADPANASDPNYVSPNGAASFPGLAVVIFSEADLAISGIIQATYFVGDGSQLTNINASQLSSGTVPLAQLPAVVVTNTEIGVTLSGAFNGNGNGLTSLNAANLTGALPTISGANLISLNASQLTSGTIPLAQLPSTVALLNSNQTFTGQNNYSGNVGIGTTNLITSLNVDVGNGGGSSAAAALFEVENCGNPCGQPAWTEAVRLWNQNGNGRVGLGFLCGTSSALTNTPNVYLGTGDYGSQSDFRIATSNNTALTDRLYINGSSGKVGIGTTTPATTLDVAGSGHFAGSVGIGTTTPSVPLDVESYGGLSLGSGYFYGTTGQTTYNALSSSVSIRALDYVAASGFIASSDARIKQIVGPSDASKDLATLNKIKVTDYTYIDKVQMGGGVSKKVIAQQLEQVYPQAVSKSRNFIPNIFAAAHVEKNGGELRFTLTKPHALRLGDKVRWIDDKAGAQQDEVTRIDSDLAFAVKSGIQPGNVFVYGTEVDDFRAVDYEAVSMLNVSATQELARRMEKLEARETHLAELEQKAAEMTRLEEEVADLKKMVVQLAQANKGARVATEPAAQAPAGTVALATSATVSLDH